MLLIPRWFFSDKDCSVHLARVEDEMDETMDTSAMDITVNPSHDLDARSELLITLSILGLFAKVTPELLERHAQFFLPYVTASARTPLRMRVLCQVDRFGLVCDRCRNILFSLGHVHSRVGCSRN